MQNKVCLLNFLHYSAENCWGGNIELSDFGPVQGCDLMLPCMMYLTSR